MSALQRWQRTELLHTVGISNSTLRHHSFTGDAHLLILNGRLTCFGLISMTLKPVGMFQSTVCISKYSPKAETTSDLTLKINPQKFGGVFKFFFFCPGVCNLISICSKNIHPVNGFILNVSKITVKSKVQNICFKCCSLSSLFQVPLQ